jgi:hypothetical protein
MDGSTLRIYDLMTWQQLTWQQLGLAILGINWHQRMPSWWTSYAVDTLWTAPVMVCGATVTIKPLPATTRKASTLNKLKSYLSSTGLAQLPWVHCQGRTDVPRSHETYQRTCSGGRGQARVNVRHQTSIATVANWTVVSGGAGKTFPRRNKSTMNAT